MSAAYRQLVERIRAGKITVGVMGLGYVGLPLVLRFCEEGFKVIGYDIDKNKVSALNKGVSYIRHIPSGRLSGFVKGARPGFSATTDARELSRADAIIICVPTPLSDKREPDLSYVEQAARTVAENFRKGRLISLESTTYPGTTEEKILPLLRRNGYREGRDFFLVFSPEREDPGRADFTTRNTPKIVGGVTKKCCSAGCELYSRIIDNVVPVASTKVAEMSKLLENIYRSVNIALVNELKMLCDRMDIDIWKVIKASSTKPFGYQAFYPGPGLGGHCIPIDPFYLTWKAREYDFSTRFIELAGEINSSMPYFVVNKVMEALNERHKSLKGSKVLVLGLAYKKDVDDLRESPSLEIIKLLKEKGAKVDCNDPLVSAFSLNGSLPARMVSVSKKNIADYDCVLIATNHADYDYKWLVENSSLVVDTRNATDGMRSPNIVKA